MDFSQQSRPIRSDFKNVIIPVPDQPGLRDCNKRYYIISLARIPSTPGGSWTYTPRPYYSILNLGEHVNLPPTEKLEYLNAFGSTAQPLDLPPPFHTDPLNPNVGNLYTPFNNYAFQTDVTMNAIKLANSEDYLLVISHLQVLFYYRVTATEIDYLGHFVDETFAGIGLPNDKLPISDGHLLTSEMEIRLLPNGKYRVAYPIVKNGGFPSGFTPTNFISFVDFSPNLVVEPASKKFAKQFSGSVLYRYYGLEFNDTGNSLLFSTYFSLNEPGLFAADYFNFTNIVGVNSPITGIDALIMAQTNLTRAELSDFARSQIERDGQGNFICTNGRSILKCTNPNGGFTNWVLESNVIPALPAVMFSTGAKTETYFGIYNISAPIYNNLNRAYWSGFDIDELIVDQDATWSPTSSPFPNKPVIYIKNKLEIAAGVQLNLENITLRFAPEAKLIIKEGTSNNVGGYLNMNNSKLEYDDRCEFAFWQGVQIHGNHDKNQEPYLRPQWQGLLVMENNSEINNAHEGVRLIDPNNWARTGGVIRTWNSKFINNRKAVEFMVYRDPINNSSSFRNTQFLVNDAYIPLQPGALTNRIFNAHVTLYDVKGVTFTACTFENNMTNKLANYLGYNRGIGSFDAGYNIYGAQTGATFYPTSFTGFDVGMDTKGSVAGKLINVNKAGFNNNRIGIDSKSDAGINITENNFNIGTFNFSGTNENYGIKTERSTKFTIEFNDFEGNGPQGVPGKGIFIENSGELANRTFKNNFLNLMDAQQTVGQNRTSDASNNLGLVFLCNINLNIDHADIQNIGTGNKDGIRIFQGDYYYNEGLIRAAGNEFSGATINFYQDNNQAPLTYHYANLPNQFPTVVSQLNVYPNLVTESARCGQQIRRGFQLPYTQSQLTSLENSYDSLEYIYQNLYFAYHQALDQGNTPLFIEHLHELEAWGTSAWDFRTLLLDESPFLTQDALRTALDLGILPAAMAFEICVANPEVSRLGEFLDWLEYNCQYPLPTFLLDALKSYQNYDSPRFLMEMKLATLSSELDEFKKLILDHYYTDSITNYNQIGYWLGKTAEYGEQLIQLDFYIDRNDFTNATYLLNLLTSTHENDETKSADLAEYSNYLDLRHDLDQQEKNLAQLDSIDLINVEALAYSTNTNVAQKARNILCFFYENCIETPFESQGRKQQPKYVSQGKVKVNNNLTVFPNPANDFVTLNWGNIGANSQGSLRIYNTMGKVVFTTQVNAKEMQYLVNTKSLPNGIYLFDLNFSEINQQFKGKIQVQH